MEHNTEEMGKETPKYLQSSSQLYVKSKRTPVASVYAANKNGQIYLKTPILTDELS